MSVPTARQGSLPVIAIDGPAASGKGTIARRVAAALGYAHLDTGKLYRAVGLAMLRAGHPLDDVAQATALAAALDPTTLDDPELSGSEAGRAASIVAAYPAVRSALLQLQQDFAARPPGGARGAVLDGRDIGTVVCPEAPVKLFVTASSAIRAERRCKELLAAGRATTVAAVLQDLEERDRRDSGRSVAPLRAAPGAAIIDTSPLDVEAAVAEALAIIHRQM